MQISNTTSKENISNMIIRPKTPQKPAKQIKVHDPSYMI